MHGPVCITLVFQLAQPALCTATAHATAHAVAAANIGSACALPAQILGGYLVPCYITLLLELRSRHAFARQCTQWRRRQLQLQGGNPDAVADIG